MSEQATLFPGFRPAAFGFFNELRDNNDPVWFKPRKAVYETEVLAPFRQLIVAVAAALQDAGVPLVGDPRRAIFRIYRDVRFSPDKRLYKTHAGAVLTRSGGKGDPGLLYIHLAPGESMIAAGFWHPEPALLTRLRRAILDDPEDFLAMAGRLAAAGYPIGSDERLTRPAARVRGGKGLEGGRACGLEVVHHACIGERRRDAVADLGRPYSRLHPRDSATAGVGLGGNR